MNYDYDYCEDEGSLKYNQDKRKYNGSYDHYKSNGFKFRRGGLCVDRACQSAPIEYRRYRRQYELIGWRDYIGRCSDSQLAEQSNVAATTSINILLCRY